MLVCYTQLISGCSFGAVLLNLTIGNRESLAAEHGEFEGFSLLAEVPSWTHNWHTERRSATKADEECASAGERGDGGAEAEPDPAFWVRVPSLRAYLMASEEISQMRGER